MADGEYYLRDTVDGYPLKMRLNDNGDGTYSPVIYMENSGGGGGASGEIEGTQDAGDAPTAKLVRIGVNQLGDGPSVLGPLFADADGYLLVREAPINQATATYGGAIETGNEWEPLMGANPSRLRLFIQNPSDTAMYVGFGQASITVNGFGTFLVPANGGSIGFDGPSCPLEDVMIVCASSGKRYVALEVASVVT